jgi:hypothetical protein
MDSNLSLFFEEAGCLSMDHSLAEHFNLARGKKRKTLLKFNKVAQKLLAGENNESQSQPG